MSRCSRLIRHLCQLVDTLLTLGVDAVGFLRLWLCSPAALAAENLFLRKQLALYQAHNITPQRATDGTRCTLIWLSHWFDWQSALAVVQPETFQRWRRQGWPLWWRGTSCPGRPPIPVELQALIRQMAHENLTWGQRRIANELRLKLGLWVSPRTVRKYMPTHLDRAPGHRVPAQRWCTFVRNHAWNLIVEVISVDQRSPPDCGPSCSHDPGLATRVISVARFDVCPAGAVLWKWNRASRHTRSARPLSKSGSQVVSRHQVA